MDKDLLIQNLLSRWREEQAMKGAIPPESIMNRFKEDTVPAMLRIGEGVLVPEAVEMLGGEQGINAINRMAEKNFETPSNEDTQNWTEEDWAEWRKRHPRFEPTPTPTPKGYAGGGVIEKPWSEPTPIPVGFFGGTENNPQFWTNTSHGTHGDVGSYIGAGTMARFGPWGAFNPMMASSTELGLYGGPSNLFARPFLDKMFSGSGNPGAGSFARGGVVDNPLLRIY